MLLHHLKQYTYYNWIMYCITEQEQHYKLNNMCKILIVKHCSSRWRTIDDAVCIKRFWKWRPRICLLTLYRLADAVQICDLGVVPADFSQVLLHLNWVVIAKLQTTTVLYKPETANYKK